MHLVMSQNSAQSSSNDEFWNTIKTAGTMLIKELAETESYFAGESSGASDSLAQSESLATKFEHGLGNAARHFFTDTVAELT